MEISINFWAVIVAAIINFVLGWLWYGPIFGKTWKNLMGFTDDMMKNMKMTPTQAMVGGFITSLVMAYVLAHFVIIVGAVNVGGALQLAFWIWLGFIATVAMGSFLWEGKPFKLFVINASYYLVSLFLMAGVLALWQ